jgi:predicted HTH domain antitoxin
MTLQIPDSLVRQAGCTPQELVFSLAAGLLMNGRITIGQAGGALGLTRPEFIDMLGNNGLPMPYDAEDAASDLRTLDLLFPSSQPA